MLGRSWSAVRLFWWWMVIMNMGCSNLNYTKLPEHGRLGHLPFREETAVRLILTLTIINTFGTSPSSCTTKQCALKFNARKCILIRQGGLEKITSLSAWNATVWLVCSHLHHSFLLPFTKLKAGATHRPNVTLFQNRTFKQALCFWLKKNEADRSAVLNDKMNSL